MKHHEVEEIVKKFKYKPGYVVGTQMLHGNELCLYVSGPTLDVRNFTTEEPEHFDIVTVMRNITITGWQTQDKGYIIEAIRNLIVGLEIHEVDEWLKYDGGNVTDPHPELK